MDSSDRESELAKKVTEILKRRLCEDSGDDDDDDDDDGNEKNYSENEIVYTTDESESDPEIECDIWDNDCKVIDKTTVSTTTGYHLMPSCSQDPEGPLNKKLKISPEIRSDLCKTDFIEQFQSNWRENRSLHSNGINLITDPFKAVVIENFLGNPSFLKEIRQEFNEIEWNMRSMDLYEFFQSKDLKHLTDFPFVQEFYHFLQNNVSKFISNLTGFSFNSTSTTCSFYSNSDYLLLHDDLRSDRMVAFILYFTSDSGWTQNDGGALELFKSDDKGQPCNVTREILPQNNQFIFFPVSNKSYHQVAEVLSLEKCRWSINGWFHTKEPPVFPPFETEKSLDNVLLRPIKMDIDLSTWINEDYLSDKIIGQVQEYFEDNSEICLKNYFREQCFNELLSAVQNPDLLWDHQGPLTRKNYKTLRNENLPQVLDRFLQLFQSKQMFLLLQRYTSLDFSGSKATMTYELQKWTPGCYSVLSDFGVHNKKELDVVLFFGCKKSNEIIGGRTQYVTVDEEIQSALITLEPDENNLNLVYRDTARVTKYFSKLSKIDCFYMLLCSYSE